MIKDALIFDGNSLAPVKRDLGLLKDRIAQMGEISGEEGKEVIEAEGLAASPGFIDMHTHSDFNPFVYPNLGNKVLQGVTTEVVGNCGMSAAPVEGPLEEEMANIWRREGVEIPKAVTWKTFKEYKSDTEFQGLETNFLSLAGHGNIHFSILGSGPRTPEPVEMEAMKKMLGAALDEGAIGISFGLTYLPGGFASREEIVSLCEVAARKNKLCAFHMRSEGRALIEAIEEVIDVARKTHAHVHISHLKAAGEKNWPKIEEAFQKIEAARGEGLEITADAYPYTASFAELGVILPDSLYQDPDRVHRFENPDEKVKILGTLRDYFSTNPASWDKIRVATVTLEKNRSYQGKTLAEISTALGWTPEAVLMNLLGEEEFRVSAFFFSQSEAVAEKVLSKPYVVIGSDSIADGSSTPHPRAFGTFSKFLAACSKKGGNVLTDPCWGAAIQKMTGLPASMLGLKDRGRIGTGLYADLVLFDPKALKDKADYDNPKVPPEGIVWVFVNGRPTVREGKYEPAHSGVFLSPEK